MSEIAWKIYMKNVENETKNKFMPIFFAGYLFSTDTKTLEILQKFQQPINSLTFSLETNIVPMKMDEFTEREKLILTSILNDRCSVAIATDAKVQLINLEERNKGKLAKLKENLKFMIDKTTAEKYVKKAKPHIKQRDLSQVRNNSYNLIL